jgi:hypothetical protein
VIAAHLVVVMVRKLGQRVMVALPGSSFAKMRTVSSLLTSIVIFLLYFTAVGLVLREFGVSLTAYLARKRDRAGDHPQTGNFADVERIGSCLCRLDGVSKLRSGKKIGGRRGEKILNAVLICCPAFFK